MIDDILYHNERILDYHQLYDNTRYTCRCNHVTAFFYIYSARDHVSWYYDDQPDREVILLLSGMNNILEVWEVYKDEFNT